ncbi:MAG TPA: hypothetical protein VGH14_04400 [Solirubrobacterales bacterium]
MSNNGCPALVDLFAEPRDQQVEQHLGACPRCRALLGAAPDSPGQLMIDVSALPSVDPSPWSDPPAEAGTIARFGAENSDFVLTALILTVSGPLMRVAPVSDEVRSATEWDLKLPAEVLSYIAVAAIAEAHEIRREQLLTTRVALRGHLWDWARKLNELHRLDEPVPADAPVGYPVLSEVDPRLRLARERAEVAEPFWSAAELFGASESFGASIRHRREALSVDAAELEELVERPGWFERLEADRLDLNGELPVPALAKLMRRLEIPPLALVTEQLRTAIESHAEALTAPTRFARRRTAVRRAGSSVPAPAVRRQVADRYLANLMSALEER